MRTTPLPAGGLAAALVAIDRAAFGDDPGELPPVDVARVRRCTGLTQEAFAQRFGFAVATLRHWEHGTRCPRGPSLVLLHVIAHDPLAVVRALRSRRPAWPSATRRR